MSKTFVDFRFLSSKNCLLYSAQNRSIEQEKRERCMKMDYRTVFQFH